MQRKIFISAPIIVLTLLLVAAYPALAQKPTAADREAQQAERQAAREAANAQRQETRDSAVEQRAATQGARFCEQNSTMMSQIQDRVSRSSEQISARFDGFEQRVTAQKERKATVMTNNQVRADERRTAQYDRLTAKAQTPEQTQAVTTYREAVEAAVAAQRTAVEASFNTFWDTYSEKIIAQKSVHQEAHTTMTTGITEALAAAAVTCTQGSDPQAAGQELRSQTRTLQQTYRESRISSSDLRREISELRRVYQADVTQQKKTYIETVQSARQALQSAFGGSQEELEEELEEEAPEQIEEAPVDL
jgi:hypothetical protein